MTTESYELKFIDGKVLNQSWFFKLLERMRFTGEKIKDRRGKEFTEDDWNLLQFLFRGYYNGEYPIMAQKLKAEEQSVMQVGLFDGNSVSTSSENIDGMVIESVTPNQNDKKDEL